MAAILQLPESRLLGQPERRWRAAICLGLPLAVGVAPVLMSLGNLPLCAFRQLSGLPCPLCGGTHACAALLQGDFLAAWQANPGVLPLLAVAAVHAGVLAFEAVSGRRMGTPRFWSWVWASAGTILLVAWALRLLGHI
jgi:hypothetical protein